MEQWILILSLKGAAGFIGLQARKHANGHWEYSRYSNHPVPVAQEAPNLTLTVRSTITNEPAVYQSVSPLHTSDVNQLQNQPQQSQQPQVSQVVDSFADALALLGPSWKYLTPEYIHPEFKQQCWNLLAKQTGMFDRINWRKACL